MDPFFLHLDRWPAWAALEIAAQPSPPPEQLCPEDPTIERLSGRRWRLVDRAKRMVGAAPCAPSPITTL